MRKIMAMLMVLVLFAGIFTGCSSSGENEQENQYNKKYNREKMITVSGEEVSIKDNENAFVDKALGFGFVKPDSWNNVNEEGMDMMVGGPSELFIGYLPSEVVEKVKNFDYEKASEEEAQRFFEDAYGKLFNFICIYRVHDDSLEDSIRSDLLISGEEKNIQSKYSKTVPLGTIEKDSYFLSYNSELPSGKLSEKDKEDMKTFIESIDELKNSIMLFPAENLDEEGAFEGNLNEFTTVDVNGKEVTQDMLKDYDITMVNIWTTWCGFCVEEMPDLAKLYKNLPENVNMITICGDAADEPELTKEILTSANAEFTTLEGNEDLENCLLNSVTGFPTTIFVDNKGNVVGVPQVGAPGGEGEIIEGYINLINEALSKIGKE